MRITELKYERTWNLGNFESEKLSAQAVLEEGDDAEAAVSQLIIFVNERKASQKVEATEAKAPKAEVKKEEPKPEVKAEPAKEECHEEENEEVQAAPSGEKRGRGRPKKTKPPTELDLMATPAPEPKQEEVAQGTEEIEAPQAEAPAAKKVTFKEAATNYNRDVELHRKILAETLTRCVPNWKSKAAQAKEVSQKLEGAPFLDSEGRVLNTFVDAVKSHMGV